MTIRNFEETDRAAVLKMVEAFYHSPGVLHQIPVSNFADVYTEMCCGGSQRLRGLLLEEEGQPAGFCCLSFSYSTEAGGPVVLIEELYVEHEYRGLGIGSAVLTFIRDEYKDKAARLRLEVAPDNTRATELYARLGFEPLTYVQMIQEDF